MEVFSINYMAKTIMKIAIRKTIRKHSSSIWEWAALVVPSRELPSTFAKTVASILPRDKRILCMSSRRAFS